MRIGVGYDVHAFTAEEVDRPLVLGGVEIPYSKGLAGHSDADVVAHAFADALLGAARLGDIGEHFPDSDPKYRGISSLTLLASTAEMVRLAGFEIIDVDCVIAAEQPKIAPYREQMRERLAACIGLEKAAVGIKATTTEGLGAIGRGEGISVIAVALLVSQHGQGS